MIYGSGYLEGNFIQTRLKLLKFDKAWYQKVMNIRKWKCENASSYLSSNSEKQVSLFDYFMYKFYVDEEFRKENIQFKDLFNEYLGDIENLVRDYPFLYDRIPIFATDFCKMLSSDTLKIRESYINQIKKILTKLSNDDSLTQNDEKELEVYFIGKIPTDDKNLLQLQDKFFRKKVNEYASHYSYRTGDDRPKCDLSGLVKKDPIAMEFISKYAVYDNLRIYLSFEEMNNVIFFNCASLDGCPASYGGVTTKNCVCMNAMITESFIEKLVDSYHEAKHIHQMSDAAYKAGGASRDIWYESQLRSLFSNLQVKNSNDSEYKLNYDSHEIELDANRNAYWRVRQLLGNHPDLCEYLSMKYDIKRREIASLDKREIDNSGYETSWQYKFSHLDQLIGEKPEYLKLYPCFLKFYDIDGSPKNIFDILCDMTHSDFVYDHNRSSGFMLDFFRYRFGKENFAELMNDFYNNSKYTSEQIKKVNNSMKNLAESVTREVDEICYGIEGLDRLIGRKKDIINMKVVTNIKILEKCYSFSSFSSDRDFENRCMEFLDKTILNNNKIQTMIISNGAIGIGSGKK